MYYYALSHFPSVYNGITQTLAIEPIYDPYTVLTTRN